MNSCLISGQISLSEMGSLMLTLKERSSSFVRVMPIERREAKRKQLSSSTEVYPHTLKVLTFSLSFTFSVLLKYHGPKADFDI